MLWNSLLIKSSILASVFAVPTTHVLHEKRDVAVKFPRRRVERDAVLPVRIGLKQTNLETGYERLMDVSHPSSPNFGKHLSAEEVHSIFSPAEESINTVKEWLIESGIEAASILDYENKGWLAVDIPAWQAERLFHTEYYESDHRDGVRIGCDEYALPVHVAPHVDFIKPGVKLSPPLKKRTVDLNRRSSARGPGHIPHFKPPHFPFPGWTLPPGAHGLPPDLQNCGVNITPVCLQALYDIPRATLHSPGNSLGVFETYDAFAQADLDLFFKNFAPWVPQGTAPTVLSVDGGTAPVAPGDARNGGESDIDIELGLALIYPQKVTVYQVDDLPNSSGETGKAGFLNTFLDSIDGSYCSYTAYGITGDSPSIDAVYPDTLAGGYEGKLECGVYTLTPVVSISYGEAEDDLPKPYVERQCNEIMKLGLQGHSILVASGDYGVASFPGEDGNEFGCLGASGTIYNPDYPSGCPYITAVGATRLYPDQTVNDPESAMQVNLTAFNIAAGGGPTSPPYDFFATGGGFSNYFTPPSYQADAVRAYLADHNELPYYIANADASNVGANGGVYNRGGRGYPDVAANGAFLTTYNDLQLFTFFGTSLSSPIFGAVLTLINEERTAIGKGPIGFVNPTLYAHPYVLNDITNGSNPNCGSEGFKASRGWDPVTGLGTPNYPRMLELYLSLP